MCVPMIPSMCVLDRTADVHQDETFPFPFSIFEFPSFALFSTVARPEILWKLQKRVRKLKKLENIRAKTPETRVETPHEFLGALSHGREKPESKRESSASKEIFLFYIHVF